MPSCGCMQLAGWHDAWLRPGSPPAPLLLRGGPRQRCAVRRLHTRRACPSHAPGKETVRRLSDLPAACQLMGVPLRLPAGLTSITTVRQLARLLAAMQGCAAVSPGWVGGCLAGAVPRRARPQPAGLGAEHARHALARLLALPPAPAAGPEPGLEDQQGPPGGGAGTCGHRRGARLAAARIRRAQRRWPAVRLPAGRLLVGRACRCGAEPPAWLGGRCGLV